ncbi:hypothetical protein M8494_10385 [Serratia ureilytica]
MGDCHLGCSPESSWKPARCRPDPDRRPTIGTDQNRALCPGRRWNDKTEYRPVELARSLKD